tara:strand:+ start:4633 stop:4956 length:324 start_codon:yes stop_codon:yes gene_type:complete
MYIDGVVQVVDAVRSLVPDAKFVLSGDEITVWKSENEKPTEAEIAAEIERLQAEYDGVEYARARALAYPSLSEFIEAYTEKEIGEDSTKWDAYVVKYNQVRTDNPKE